MSFVVRPVGAADRQLAARLLTAQLEEHRLPVDEAGIGRGISLALAPGSAAWLRVAERDGKAVGIFLANLVVSVERGGFTLWVEELYVVPDARRTGVARAMLEMIFADARAAGVSGVDLEVVRTQAAAFALYRSLGFVTVDRERLTLGL